MSHIGTAETSLIMHYTWKALIFRRVFFGIFVAAYQGATREIVFFDLC
jgi:hypothetical protein